MKKNSLLIICFVLVLGLSFFAFAGCNNVPSAETTGGVSSGENTDGGSTEQPVAPELKNMSYYFSGVKAEYLKNEIKNENNSIVDFNDLLDRQIEVLTEDVLYRLYLTYGSITYGTSSKYQDKVLYNENYSKDGLFAKVLKNYALTKEEIQSTIPVNYDNIMCYQQVIKTGGGSSYKINSTAFIMLEDAILGEYSEYDSDARALKSSAPDFVDYYDPTPYKWAYSNNAEDFTSWYNNYKESLKLEIAKALYDETTNLSYEEILNGINYLGYNASFATKLENIIYKVIIGENLVDRDLEIYNTLTETDKTSPKNWSDESEISKHFYKGYNIVIPAIVEQALNNTFENTETSIYPVLNRMAVESTVNADGFADAKKYSSVLLMPKTNAPTTKLIVNLEGVGESVGKTITIDYVVAISTESYHGKITVTLENVNQEIELNLDAITDGAKLNAYNGAKENYTSTDLFGANENSDINDGNNYIKLMFNNTDNAAFKVTFKGMYDKVQ